MWMVLVLVALLFVFVYYQYPSLMPLPKENFEQVETESPEDIDDTQFVTNAIKSNHNRQKEKVEVTDLLPNDTKGVWKNLPDKIQKAEHYDFNFLDANHMVKVNNLTFGRTILPLDVRGYPDVTPVDTGFFNNSSIKDDPSISHFRTGLRTFT
jgi:hypothetical protein